MNWKKRKRLTRLIHKHKLDRHSDYKKWLKEWCIVSGYYGKSRYQLLKEWRDSSIDEYIEKVQAAIIKHTLSVKLRKALKKAIDKVREETAKVKPLPLQLRSIDEFSEFMSNLPQYVPPSEEEWDEGMKRAEAFHQALNGEEK